jgi:hypothetical protein
MVTTYHPVLQPDVIQQLPAPGKPSPLMWKLVPSEIRLVLLQQGCFLIKQWDRKPHQVHVRFQYAPMVFDGELFYLQRWAPVEWSVSPSGVIFCRENWPVTEITLRRGAYLANRVRQVVAQLYPASLEHLA